MPRGTIPCFVHGCSNRAGDKENPRSFFRIPKILVHQSEEVKELSTKRRLAWIAALDRKRQPSIYSRICEDHFLGKKPAKLHETGHPDWAPSLLLKKEERDENTLDESMHKSQDKLKR